MEGVRLCRSSGGGLVVLVDEAVHPALAEVETEVARLLSSSLTGRSPGAAREPGGATAPVRDTEEHSEATQQDRLDGGEVAGNDTGPCELRNSPRLGSRRRGAGSGPA